MRPRDTMKIVFIGAGSAKFTRTLVADILSYAALRDSHIALMDIDQGRLDTISNVVRKMIDERGGKAIVSSTTDQRKAVENADFVIITVMVGGLPHYHSDSAIPAGYGVLQTVGDTTGPGGVFRCVRTFPVLNELVQNLKEVAPRAWILNYTNPMAMNVWSILELGHENCVGLCHSIQGCAQKISRWLNVPDEDLSYTAAGINHVNYYLKLEHHGEDLYPRLRSVAGEIVKDQPQEKVRFELLKYLGHFPAEGPYHQAEYSAWFQKNEERSRDYGVRTFWGYEQDSRHRQDEVTEMADILSGKKKANPDRSHEYGAQIIHSMVTDQPLCIYGNVRNLGLIDNLPRKAVVEVPCLVDREGIHPCRAGRIPAQLAAVMLPHVMLHELAVSGCLNKDREKIRQALQADPLVSAQLTLPQIEEMFIALCEENASYLAAWNCPR